MGITPSTHDGRRVTLREVAQAAGVSTATVTRTLQNSHRVEETTRRRVLEAVSQLGYTPNPAAQVLRRGRRDGAVGLVTSGFTNLFQAGVAAGAERELRRADLQTIIASTDDDPSREPAVTQAMIDRRVSALMVMPDGDDRGYLTSERTFGTPIVLVGRPSGDLAADTVMTSDDEGVREAARRLADLGHTRIAALAGRASSFAARRRLAGFRRGLADGGRIADPRLVVADLTTPDEARAALSTLLEQGEPPTAVLALNLGISTGVLLERLAGALPFAFIAFDETDLSAGLGITAIVRDPQEVGRQAARLSLARLEAPGRAPQAVTLPTRILARGSGEIPADQVSASAQILSQ